MRARTWVATTPSRVKIPHPTGRSPDLKKFIILCSVGTCLSPQARLWNFTQGPTTLSCTKGFPAALATGTPPCRILATKFKHPDQPPLETCLRADSDRKSGPEKHLKRRIFRSLPGRTGGKNQVRNHVKNPARKWLVGTIFAFFGHGRGPCSSSVRLVSYILSAIFARFRAERPEISPKKSVWTHQRMISDFLLANGVGWLMNQFSSHF